MFSENRAVYEIMGKKLEKEPDRPQMTQYGARVLHAGYLTQEYGHTLKIFNTYCFPRATMVRRTHLNNTLYSTYISCVVTAGMCCL
jgi:hypothetical protein